MQDLDFLKKVLSVPTKTYQEGKMVEFIINWCIEKNLDYHVDKTKNVYVTKFDELKPESFFFPCVIAHTDTVHNLDSINIVEMELPNAQDELKLALKAYNDKGDPTGIGGDDKAGVFACMKLVEELPNIKAAFFVSEEIGCIGSTKANEEFFENVGYVIQFDAPENWMVTETCFGQRLFDRNSEFFKSCDQVLTESMDPNYIQYMSHPYTDVWAMRNKFNFSCINFSIGYYNYHTPNEYVVVEDVFNGIEIGRKMIEKLGYNLHYKKADPNERRWKI